MWPPVLVILNTVSTKNGASNLSGKNGFVDKLFRRKIFYPEASLNIPSQLEIGRCFFGCVRFFLQQICNLGVTLKSPPLKVVASEIGKCYLLRAQRRQKMHIFSWEKYFPPEIVIMAFQFFRFRLGTRTCNAWKSIRGPVWCN